MKKVITVTMNPCIDRTITVDGFAAGQTNHVLHVSEQVAGKGINVGLTLRHYQLPVKNLLFGYTENLSQMKAMFEKEKAEYELIEVPGRLRVNLKIFDRGKKEMTECNEYGDKVSREAVEKFLGLLAKNLPDCSILVLNGSAAPGVPKDIYARMIQMAEPYQIPVILDAAGELLSLGICERPYLVKPNLEEFTQAFLTDIKEKTDREQSVEEKAAVLAEKYSCMLCISQGAEGALLIGKGRRERASSYPVEVKGLQGAGDAMVAGICASILEKKEEHMLTYALASAAGAVMLEGTQTGSLKSFRSLLAQRT